MPSKRIFVLKCDRAKYQERDCVMDINEVLEKVAEMNGVTVEEVKAEMQKAIREDAKDPSPEFKSRYGDREPDIGEFLEMMSSQVTKRMGS